MYYINEGDQEEGGRICLGIRLEIQNLNRPIDFLDPR
jgi:hypothetical protein